MTKQTKILLVLVGSVLALALALLINYGVENARRSQSVETDPAESYTASHDRPMTYAGDLSRDAYPIGTPAGDWLSSCDDAGRDDQFRTYILCHTTVAGEETTYTYLIYFKHGGSGYTATPTLYEGEDGGRRIDLTYTSASGREDYALSRLTVTLPSGEDPYVRLFSDGESMSSILTVTDSPIP